MRFKLPGRDLPLLCIPYRICRGLDCCVLLLTVTIAWLFHSVKAAKEGDLDLDAVRRFLVSVSIYLINVITITAGVISIQKSSSFNVID
jgi:hypothetical protein